MQIEIIPQENLAQALALVERVFMQFEASDYLPEGILTFRTFLHNPDAVSALVFYGAYIEDQLVGVLATRGSSHIALFFVEPCFQRQGVGRHLGCRWRVVNGVGGCIRVRSHGAKCPGAPPRHARLFAARRHLSLVPARGTSARH